MISVADKTAIIIKNSIHSVVKFVINETGLALLLLLVSFTGCRTDEHANKNAIVGQAQGTTYHITWFSKDNMSLQTEVDSLLQQLDLSLSTYVPESVISKINRNETAIADGHFINVFKKAQEISVQTEGAFDVTVAPLINAYGFGFTKKGAITDNVIDSLRKLVGFPMVKLLSDSIVKEKTRVQLDFNAIAQGYSVDVIAAYLDKIGIQHYLVELGGEVKAKGFKEHGEHWKVGIDSPEDLFPGERKLKAVVKMKDRAMATSGNYRRFYEENGKRYAHIIDPHTGYPARHNLLSATVFADDCMTADAYATAFMVMGMERAKKFLTDKKELNLEVFFIYDEQGEWKTYSSESLLTWVEELP